MKALAAALLTLALVGGCAAQATTSGTVPSSPTSPTSRTSASASHSTKRSVPRFDRTRHSLTDPASIWVIVNKSHPISPLDFVPRIALVRGYQVATAAARPLTHLLDAADRAGVPLKIASAYRSFGYQEGVHSHLVATMGPSAADAISARPGYSEHQTGLAVDLSHSTAPALSIRASSTPRRTLAGRTTRGRSASSSATRRQTVGRPATRPSRGTSGTSVRLSPASCMTPGPGRSRRSSESAAGTTPEAVGLARSDTTQPAGNSRENPLRSLWIQGILALGCRWWLLV